MRIEPDILELIAETDIEVYALRSLLRSWKGKTPSAIMFRDGLANGTIGVLTSANYDGNIVYEEKSSGL